MGRIIFGSQFWNVGWTYIFSLNGLDVVIGCGSHHRIGMVQSILRRPCRWHSLIIYLYVIPMSRYYSWIFIICVGQSLYFLSIRQDPGRGIFEGHLVVGEGSGHLIVHAFHLLDDVLKRDQILLSWELVGISVALLGCLDRLLLFGAKQFGRGALDVESPLCLNCFGINVKSV